MGKIEDYIAQLLKWNEFFNLTSFEKENIYNEAVSVGKIFCKEIADESKFAKVCDIGTGAGIPGIIIKILMPEAEVSLIESSRKKASFLGRTIELLNLEKISVINEDAHIVAKRQRNSYNFAVGRAFGNDFPRIALKLLAEGGKALYFLKKEKKFHPPPDEIKRSEEGIILKWVK